MNQQHFVHKVRHYLNLGSEDLDRKTADRLYAARQRALARQRVASSALSLPGVGQISADVFMPYARTFVAVVGLALGVAGISYWSSLQQAAEIEDIDTALLSDDLPINAYLDRGFDAWLKHSSQE